MPALAVIACASVLMAPLRASSACTACQTTKRVFAFVLYALAAYMLYKGLVAT